MKTDDLVDMLSTNLDAVDWRGVSRRLLSAAALGAIAALAGMMLLFGPRTDISDLRAWIFLAVKFAFAGALVAISLAYLVRVAHPGGEQRVSLALVVLPFAAALVVLVVTLVLAPPSAWQAMIFGEHWLLCISCIPLNAIFPFAAIIFAMREFALPTNLTRAGALAGLAAGSISAVVYALHCTDDSLAFIALWYGLTIALCTVIGALLGPKLLRW
ncbi:MULTISPECIES: DUF1109 domain-containing protein [unclassified Bradyrhizobium]|uniref:DUF1109 domain-containing protein n=1 Tax=unclassified Bradyrhizobium TaxID=2631580 RepID=UPI00247A5FEE|nr:MULTISPECIES: DUF1109 domain-containing protein [unclassified Bradyrhizobium]WGS21097.1 DUF1109 domain-containing protein [Bradyrhizobium sp. ISRA463]WGS28015.1 DUF1109 domain-containing protein [Bradyrhizobium sp. ISRA464]